ncbi:MAG: VanZ family protein [Candidatus Devosia phytovorans]|uniref:VanZ family protein n=1 Tax=Candidatus Devosia phytovorans TaxID=3121372 RepID=A0AAJ5VRY5_9HYPH|nr:VanZ family protein [Devosia sp.]WEK03703.1 MAG: VanZ family protein [Devosia sp.]
MNRHSTVVILAWLGLLAIAVMTLSPIGLRPHMPVSVNAERAMAFMVVGFLFAVAYPRHIWFAALIVLTGAFGLEILQELRPDRHGRFRDAMWKSVGASIGLCLGWFAVTVLPNLRRLITSR